ncbi:serine/threonine-protein kinase [Haliangium sp.]|uniref:serine/threonine-protein kinase n=1 Tax=Haliangium sp. TaxID=2663208 RepID=UPI003D0F46BB
MKVTDGGRKVVGRYEIIKTLGKGAMGVVYQARDPALDRIVAIKTIVSPRKGKRVHAAYIERFKREAQAAAKMQHPAIVTIYDVGIESDAPYMVLEYLPGESLADRLDRVRIRLGRAVQIGLDLASALAFAHRQRIVHRDVKPANVLHAGENRWKLADFGIARMPDSDLTQVGVFMGTPGYSPPESIKFGHYTPQADVFAWGAVLYELLSGRIPYEGPDTRTTNGYVIKATAQSPRKYDPSIPEPLAEVVMTALDPSVKERYKDGAGAEQALREAWEMCVNANMIPPSCLVGEDIPHDKVRGPMHQGAVVQLPASMAGQAGGHSVAQAATQPADDAPDEPAATPMLIIESSRERISDEAPTRVMVRDPDEFRAGDNRPRAGGHELHMPSERERLAATGVAGMDDNAASGQHPAVQSTGAQEGVPRPIDSAAGPNAEANSGASAPIMTPHSTRALFWVGLGVLALTAVAVLVHLVTR